MILSDSTVFATIAPLTPMPPTTTKAPVVVVVEATPLLATTLPLKISGPPPVLVMVPLVIRLPVAASIVNGPTVRPFCTIKLLFAIVPYSLVAFYTAL